MLVTTMMMIMATMMIMMIRRMVGQVHITAPPLMVIKGGPSHNTQYSIHNLKYTIFYNIQYTSHIIVQLLHTFYFVIVCSIVVGSGDQYAQILILLSHHFLDIF